MKFKEERCGNCGFDLTTVEPVRGRDIPMGDEDEMTPHAPCPKCHANRIVVDTEAEAAVVKLEPEPKPPVARGGRRRASEPEPAPSPAEPDVTPPEE